MKPRTFKVAIALSATDVRDITAATSDRAIRRDVAAFVRDCIDACALQVLAARRAEPGPGEDDRGDGSEDLDAAPG